MSYRIETLDGKKLKEHIPDQLNARLMALDLAKGCPGTPIYVKDEKTGNVLFDTCCSRGGEHSTPLEGKTSEVAPPKKKGKR
jgi:hypothetical protein